MSTVYDWDVLFKNYFPRKELSGQILARGYNSWDDKVGHENRGTYGELLYCPKDYGFLHNMSREAKESLMDYITARYKGEGYQGDPEAELKKLGVIKK